MEKKIIIIGGGISGLALAQGLKKNNIKFKLFERDESENFRSQGYRIRISPEGSHSLKEMLNDELWQLFKDTCAKTSIGGTSINAITGEITRRVPNMAPNMTAIQDSSMVFTVDRTTLRSLLTIGIKDSLEFGKKFTQYELIQNENGESKVKVHFSDGTSDIGDLLVGADGVNSLIRKQFVPGSKQFDTNGRCIYGKTPITNKLLQELPASCMEWVTTIVDESSKFTLFMEPIRFNTPNIDIPSFEPEKNDYIYWVFLGLSSQWGKTDQELFNMPQNQLKEYQLQLIEKWNPKFREIIINSDESKSSYLGITSSFPDVYTWETNENITLMGDSIHNMSPTGGSGANTALHDCPLLLQAIKNGSKKEDLKQYEEKMREFAKGMINGSLGGAKKLFGFTSIDDCKIIN